MAGKSERAVVMAAGKPRPWDHIKAEREERPVLGAGKRRRPWDHPIFCLVPPHGERPTGVDWVLGVARCAKEFACPFCPGMVRVVREQDPHEPAGVDMLEHLGVACKLHKTLTPGAFVAAARRHIR